MPATDIGSKLRETWGLFDYSAWGWAETAVRIGGIVIGLSAPAGLISTELRDKQPYQYAEGALLLIMAILIGITFIFRIQLKCFLAVGFGALNLISHGIIAITLFFPDPLNSLFLILFSGLGLLGSIVKILDFTVGKFILDIEAEGTRKIILWVELAISILLYLTITIIQIYDMVEYPITEQKLTD